MLAILHYAHIYPVHVLSFYNSCYERAFILLLRYVLHLSYVPRAATSLRDSMQATRLLRMISAIVAHDIAVLEYEGHWLEAVSNWEPWKIL